MEVQDRQIGSRWRYPSNGLHWMLGLVLLAQGDAALALDEFTREIEGGATTSLYRREFTMDAHGGRGFALLAMRRLDAAARAM